MDQDQAKTLLIFQVGPYSFCVSALEVESIISLPTITAIPFAPKSVAGTCLYHKKVAMVISLHQKFGLKRNSAHNNEQLIVTQLESGLAAFWVDAVHDVATSVDKQWQKISAAHSKSVFDHFLLKDGHIILYTSFETLYKLPDAKHIDDALRSLASLGAKQNSADQENGLPSRSPDGVTENKQLNSDSALDAVISKNNHLENASLKSPLDIFDFESTPHSQADLVKDPPGYFDFSVDEHDAFDENNGHESAKKKSVGTKGQKTAFTKPLKKPDLFSDKKKGTRIQTANNGHFFAKKSEPLQEESSGLNPRRNNLTVWACLISLLLFVAGTFWLWPSRPEQKKALSHQETYERKAKKHEAQKDFKRDEKKQARTKYSNIKEEALVSIFPEEQADQSLTEIKVQNPSPYTSSSKEAENVIQPPAEAENVVGESEIADEEHLEPEREFIAQESIVEPARLAGPEIVAQKNIILEKEKTTPIVSTNEEGEIFRVENKDFALIVERPAKEEVLILDEAPKKKSKFHEYVHTVVRGDTLWAIAKKFLGDPFLYNELAKNSAIKNPDLIYPGDRVRIIKKSQTP